MSESSMPASASMSKISRARFSERALLFMACGLLSLRVHARTDAFVRTGALVLVRIGEAAGPARCLANPGGASGPSSLSDHAAEPPYLAQARLDIAAVDRQRRRGGLAGEGQGNEGLGNVLGKDLASQKIAGSQVFLGALAAGAGTFL